MLSSWCQVAHELSVPAVSTILLSTAAWVSASATGVLLAEALSARPLLALRAAAAAGALGTVLAVTPPHNTNEEFVAQSALRAPIAIATLRPVAGALVTVFVAGQRSPRDHNKVGTRGLIPLPDLYPLSFPAKQLKPAPAGARSAVQKAEPLHAHLRQRLLFSSLGCCMARSALLANPHYWG